MNAKNAKNPVPKRRPGRPKTVGAEKRMTIWLSRKSQVILVALSRHWSCSQGEAVRRSIQKAATKLL